MWSAHQQGTVIVYRGGRHIDLVKKKRQIATKDQMCDRAMAIPAVDSHFECINTKYPSAVRRREESVHWVQRFASGGSAPLSTECHQVLVLNERILSCKFPPILDVQRQTQRKCAITQLHHPPLLIYSAQYTARRHVINGSSRSFRCHACSTSLSSSSLRPRPRSHSRGPYRRLGGPKSASTFCVLRRFSTLNSATNARWSAGK